ncbi:hypothetical protein BGZ60DRAFT_394417 [Tricladium varicosporioides]|nr:hypothetical protein BGZ60DRAFT_394417 [Hymenoscyphus varicosporioides]
MRLNSILALPTAVLLLLSEYTVAAEVVENDQPHAQWQQSLEQAGHWPKAAIQRRRMVEEHLRSGRSPVGVMKMSPDEGEKFYMEYWQFEGDSAQVAIRDALGGSLRAREEVEETRLLANGSMVLAFRPPFALHMRSRLEREELRARSIDAAAALAMLEKRDFVCPTGTSNCASIQQPNYCCGTNEICFAIQDTGLGPVGCCPRGTTCGGIISSCASPNTPCAQNLGGACCIPNYVCQGVGCVLNTTAVVIVTQAPTTLSSSSTTIQATTSASTTSPVLSTTTSTSSIRSTTTTTPRSTTSGTTVTGVAPVRPTDASSVTTTATATDTSCPVAFYACSATYGGGCCRTGRDCAVTSCPVTSSTTIISSGQTIVVPVGTAATVTSPTGSCATGWSSCAASVGGNCCPSGFACGIASCSSISPIQTLVVQKGSPSRGSKLVVNSMLQFGVGLMLLLVFL